MWLFGYDGVVAYSPNGGERRSHVPNELVCEEPDPDVPSHRYCRFRKIVSDGKGHVFAGLSHPGHPIAVFDIDTGSLVGTFNSCVGPNDLEYQALRDEVWVRCTGLDANSTDPTHLKVFSASNPSGEIGTDILLKERALVFVRALV